MLQIWGICVLFNLMVFNLNGLFVSWHFIMVEEMIDTFNAISKQVVYYYCYVYFYVLYETDIFPNIGK